jgi:PAS domain S-box-containing protein
MSGLADFFRNRLWAPGHRALDREIRARQEAEEKLQRYLESDRLGSEATLRSYFEAASQAILAVSPDGRIRLVNRRTEEMFGYERSELLDQELELLLPDRYRTSHVGRRAEYFAEPRVRAMGAGMNLAGRRKDGTEFPVEIGLGHVKTGEGVMAIGLVSDITNRKKRADELAQANEALRRSNAELEQFAHVASHDLQEPLRMITSYLAILERRYGGQIDDDAREFIHYAVDGATRMKVLIQDLLRFSRAGMQALDLRAVPAESILESALANLQVAIENRRAEITWDPLPPVFADPVLLTQLFQNLIGNAIKFQKDTPPVIHISSEKRGEEWIFRIRDNGIGIDAQHASRIFLIFERLHGIEEYPGSGIGLAISKKIAERHGGRIWFESTPGAGSTFYFSIPMRIVGNEAPPVVSAAHAG